jgi:hypothetical protein
LPAIFITVAQCLDILVQSLSDSSTELTVLFGFAAVSCLICNLQFSYSKVWSEMCENLLEIRSNILKDYNIYKNLPSSVFIDEIISHVFPDLNYRIFYIVILVFLTEILIV